MITFSPHADFQTLLEATVLTLISMMLINRARAERRGQGRAPMRDLPIAAACVVQVAPDGALEEALASLTGHLTVMLPAALVAAHHAHQVLALARALLVDAVPVTGLGHVGARHASRGRGDEAGTGVGEGLDVRVL